MGYIKKSGDFLSSDGHSKTNYFIWAPENAVPSAILQISHGMCEYIERYESEGFVGAMTDAGLVVCGNDHIGHGRRALESGKLGCFTDYTNLVDDLHTMNGIVRQTYRSLPYTLLGHSMGSFVARLTYARYDDYDALVACGTGGNNPGSGFGVVLTKIIKAFKGSHARSKLLYALVFGTYNKKFGATGGFEWLTRDTDMVAIHDADKLCTFDFSVSALLDLITLNRRANSKKWFEAVDTEKPVLLIAGSDDPVGNYGKGVKEVYDRLVATGHKNVSLKLYDGARHEILNETNRDEVNKDLTDFIRSVTEE